MKRVLVIANKTWEVEPMLNAMLNPEFKPEGLLVQEQVSRSRADEAEQYVPRATISYAEFDILYEIWCIQDLMDENKPSSSSEEKFKSLPLAFKFRNRKSPDLVVAFGTAGFLMPYNLQTNQEGYVESNNGCVVIGSHIFIHDGHPIGDENPSSMLHLADKFEKEISTKTLTLFFEQLISSVEFVKNVEKRFLKPYLNPSNEIRLIINQNLIGLSIVNITDYMEYGIKDLEGVKAVVGSGTQNEIGSIETTHGIIKILSDSPFIFVSGITDRVGHFNEDLNLRKESQNYACAYNAGIAIAWIIPEVNKFFKQPAA